MWSISDRILTVRFWITTCSVSVCDSQERSNDELVAVKLTSGSTDGTVQAFTGRMTCDGFGGVSRFRRSNGGSTTWCSNCDVDRGSVSRVRARDACWPWSVSMSVGGRGRRGWSRWSRWASLGWGPGPGWSPRGTEGYSASSTGIFTPPGNHIRLSRWVRGPSLNSRWPKWPGAIPLWSPDTASTPEF